MERPARSTANQRGLPHVPLLSGCGIAFVAAFAVIASDKLGDVSNLGLRVAAFAFLAIAGFVALSAARSADTARRRTAFRCVLAGVVFLGAGFAYASYADASVELASLLSPDDSAGPDTTIELGPTGKDVRLTGELRDGAADRLDALLDEHPEVARIHLTSDGGLADEGKALADVISAHRLVTFVPDYCVSACTLAFLGGRERYAMTDARLGFHTPYEEGLFGQVFQGDSSLARDAYLGAGVASEFVDRALQVPSSEMWFPSAHQLVTAHVVTRFVDRYRFPDSNLDGSATNEGARDEIERGFPVMRAFEMHAPRALDSIAAWYLAAYRQGRSEGEVVDRLKAIIESAVLVALAQADDATLVRTARYILAAERAAEPSAPLECAKIGENADLVAAQRLLDKSGAAPDRATRQDDEGTALVEAALDDGAPHRVASEAPSFTIMSADLRTEAPRAACDDLVSAYENLLREPKSDGAAQLRSLLAAQVPQALAAATAIAKGRFP